VCLPPKNSSFFCDDTYRKCFLLRPAATFSSAVSDCSGQGGSLWMPPDKAEQLVVENYYFNDTGAWTYGANFSGFRCYALLRLCAGRPSW
jgi:hypothetical protein